MSEKITIYHNNQCSKSREALALLREKSADFTIIEYLKENQSAKEVLILLTKLGLSAHELMRKGEQDYKDHVKGKTLSEKEMIDLLVKYPKLIERPIIVKGNKAIIGRPPTLVVDFII
jgi:arsenate reductase